MPIETLIVDDERLARQRLRRLLETQPDIAIAGECASGPEAADFLDQRPVDLLFLDIQMPEMDGFAFLESRIAQKSPVVVFVTAHDEHAVRAFEVSALDYLLKPFDEERLDRCLQRIRAHFEVQRSAGIAGPNKPRPNRLAVRSSGKVFFVRMDDIDWVEAADNYIVLHLGGETHILRETMNSIQSRLDPRKFIRVHRSRIVNVERIKELQPWFHGEYMIVLNDGTQLTLSRNYREKLMEFMAS
ncbi:MAG: LytTR family DNA-binding domain-containing protein [Bryobacteraceae bacterium]|jgi:two-component system LytT family response regulator|nr:LytTR family DNA-binding domain-containing protein [Bryobacteraceae bacterium]